MLCGLHHPKDLETHKSIAAPLITPLEDKSYLTF